MSVFFLPSRYIPSLLNLVMRSGRGFAARAVSYAGHGIPDDIADVEKWISRKGERDTDIPWTLDGQIKHKEAYMDILAAEMKEERSKFSNQQRRNNSASPRYIFMAHSIGCFMIQRLMILRPDILQQTDLLLWMMPFNRMKSDWWSEFILFTFSSNPDTVIGHAQSLMKLLAALPVHVLDTLLKGDIKCENGRKITIDILQQPHFGRNFFELGLEEVRDLPEIHDQCAYRTIGKHCPTEILYVGTDKWAPKFHMTDIHQLQSRGIIPNNIYSTYLPNVVHDYVVRPHMVPPVDDFCFRAIQKHVLDPTKPRSRL